MLVLLAFLAEEGLAHPVPIDRLVLRVQQVVRRSLALRNELGEQLDGGKQEVRRRRVDNRPIAGTRLIREWQGCPYEVVVGVDHFEYQ
ncbi:MAG: DUF2924 domain-containing protein, partial [Actinobacteria bacterium]|nr:DUF2924 domain-containing protein [Actinomycetota bacterium]